MIEKLPYFALFPYFGVQADFLFHKLVRHSIYVVGSEMAIKFIHSNNG